LKEKNISAYENFEFISEYESTDKDIIIKDKYGFISANPTALLNGQTPTIIRAINKHEYFLNVLKEKNPLAYNSLEFITEYTGVRDKILANTKYGIVEIYPSSLSSGNMPDIRNAINQTEYWINKAREINGDVYDYSKSICYEKATRVTVTCRIHGDFDTNLRAHYVFGTHCPHCYKEIIIDKGGWSRRVWVRKGNESKHFDSYKLYKIKCFDGNEEFYKIGITYNIISYRFNKNYFPYKYEIIDIIESNNGEYIWDLEKELHKKHKHLKYKPEKEFAGMYECYTSLIVE
jgi:hypothetical protein